MTTRISNAAALAACNATVDLLDAGDGAGALLIYAGDVPAAADAAITTQTLLVTIPLPATAFGNAVDINPGARATANAIDPAQATATGTASFFRAVDGDGDAIIQGDVGAELTLNTADIVEDVEVSITSWTHTQPES